MLDEKSLIVTYKDWRGEPRGKAGGGDCVDCNLCAAVCPTGIDIREGAQIGCITCALCIDACERDGQDGPPARPDRLRHAGGWREERAGRRAHATPN
jgi:polyferredoxin